MRALFSFAGTLLLGCYGVHDRATAELDAAGLRDAGAVLRDAGVGPPAPVRDVDASADSCRTMRYEPSRCGALPLPPPALSMSFEGSLATSGTWGVGASVRSGDYAIVEGARGRAVRLREHDVVALPGTAARLAGAPALTFAFWVREPEGPTDAKSFLDCRSTHHGFEIYRGVSDERATICVGARNELWGPAACAPYSFCHDGQWHHVVLRYAAPAVEVFVDGRLDTVARPEGAAEGWDLFATAGDLTIGERAGAGPREGTLELDELRVWADALDDAQVIAAPCDGPP